MNSKNVNENKFVNLFVLLYSTLVSIGATSFYYLVGYTLAYNDATSHLNIARRITHSLTPGLVQIGSNWLPLLHLLELPFVSNYYLWQSGLGGSIVSMASFVLSSFLIYKIIQIVTNSKSAGLFSSLMFVTNANILYMQSVAMFELLLICTSLAGIYFLLLWTKTKNSGYLVISAFFVLLSTLTRYDGWFLFLGSCVGVFVISYLEKGYRSAEGKSIMFATLSGLGIILWFIYNYLIFGRVSYFMTSEFSARGQQVIWEGLGRLPAKHNMIISLITYAYASLYNSGVIAAILGIFGFLLFILRRNISIIVKICLLLLSVPFIFNVIALYIGHSIIWVPDVKPFDDSFFNVRYGLLMMPFFAAFSGILFDSVNQVSSKLLQGLFKVVLICLLIFQSVIFYGHSLSSFNVLNIATLRDTKAGNTESANLASEQIKQSCSEGLTLISAAGYESIVFKSGIDLTHFITEGTGKYWKESLINPSKHADCIFFGDSWLDTVEKAMTNNADFENNFHIKSTSGSYKLYVRN